MDAKTAPPSDATADGKVSARGSTRDLGVHGWSRLDAVLLAALATEAPLLLVGPHGTAKTLLVERLAGVLGLELRHYHASLVNYDDPMNVFAHVSLGQRDQGRTIVPRHVEVVLNRNLKSGKLDTIALTDDEPVTLARQLLVAGGHVRGEGR